MAKPVQQDLKQLHDSYRAVFDSKDGERVLTHLCKVGFVNDTSYVSGDPYETAHREGQRRLVLSILRFLDRTPQEILHITEELTNE